MTEPTKNGTIVVLFIQQKLNTFFSIIRISNGGTIMLKDETIKKVIQFRDDRNWRQFHEPKDLAISINLEAAELLEVFQWSGADTVCVDKIDKIKEELADIINYCILLADRCQLDIDKIVNEKLSANEKKYPIDKAYGISKKYSEL